MPGWAMAELELPDRPLRRAAARPVLQGLAGLARRLPAEIPAQAYARMGRTAP